MPWQGDATEGIIDATRLQLMETNDVKLTLQSLRNVVEYVRGGTQERASFPAPVWRGHGDGPLVPPSQTPAKSAA